MKKKHIITLLAAILILVAGGSFLLKPSADLLENDPEEESDGFFDILDEDVPLSDLPMEETEETEPVDPYEGLDATQIKYVDEIVKLVNEARAKEGLQPLTLDPLLRKGAQLLPSGCRATSL